MHDITAAFHEFQADGERVIVEATLTETVANGSHSLNDYWFVFEPPPQDRLVQRVREYVDTAREHHMIFVEVPKEFVLTENPDDSSRAVERQGSWLSSGHVEETRWNGSHCDDQPHRLDARQRGCRRQYVPPCFGYRLPACHNRELLALRLTSATTGINHTITRSCTTSGSDGDSRGCEGRSSGRGR